MSTTLSFNGFLARFFGGIQNSGFSTQFHTLVGDRVASYHIGNRRLLVLFVVIRTGRGDSKRLTCINIDDLVFDGIPIRRSHSADGLGQRTIHTPVIVNPRGIGYGQTECQRRTDGKCERTLLSVTPTVLTGCALTTLPLTVEPEA